MICTLPLVDEYSARLLAAAEQVTRVWATSLLARFGTTRVALEGASALIDAVATTVHSELRQFLETDPEQQRTNPLAIFRRATKPITEHLQELDVPPVDRDEFEQRSFPEDPYGLYPATWADISGDLVEPGLEWGAWKAAVIISRHRPPTKSEESNLGYLAITPIERDGEEGS